MSIGRRRFRIIKEIAEGGFGKVYLAEQISSDGFSRIVAVKLLHAKWSSHDEVVMRTRDEARLLGLIRHQHIVKVEDLTAIDGKAAIVMEYLEGIDLKWMIQFLKDREEVFPRAALFEIMLAVASALDAAYNGSPLQGGDALQVIHRDIKPSNIFVTVAGGVKVLDFGTARANFAEREAKTQALAFGSQGYMAPERMLGEEDTPAADVFSLGITLYELLSLESFGRIPPRPNKFMKKIDDRVSSIALDGDKDWCDQVRDTVRLMLSYDPTDRPSATQLIEIMEMLTQDATDMGLRRYCRTLVAEAKAKLPELDTGDPLTGTIVDEDVSATQGGLAQDASGTLPQPPPGLPGNLRTVEPGQAFPSVPSAPVPHSSGSYSQASSPAMASMVPAETGGRSKTIPLLILGFSLLVIGIIVVSLVFGVGAAVMIGGGGTDAVTDVVQVPPDPHTDPAPTVDPAPSGGATVVAEDSRSGVATVATVLRFNAGEGGEVDIRGPGGYRAKWDGKADFDMGLAGEGVYSTTVSSSAGKKWRLKKFKVDPKDTSCSFLFDTVVGDWTGGCGS